MRQCGTAAAASPGVAIGRVQKVAVGRMAVPEFHIPASQVPDEVERLRHAIQASIAQLEQQQTNLAGVHSKDPMHILDAHRMLLKDPELTDGAIRTIKQERINAEWALARQIDEISSIFDAIEDEYLRSKKNDVEQIGRRILDNLAGSRHMDFDPCDQDMILVGESFSPGDAVHIWHQGLAGFIAEKGGVNSHTIIVARSIGLPALVGAGDIRRAVRDGDTIVIDGRQGEWIVNPGEDELTLYRDIAREMRARRVALMSLAGRPSVDKAGRALPIMANMEFIEELPLAMQIGVDGIGLYRTEFLFMNHTSPPDEEEQYAHYRQVVRGMRGRPVTFRILDIGGDKPALFQRLSGHAWMGDNPAMGLRGIRLLLQCPDILRAQLRALVRTAAEGPVSILIPMVVSVDEVTRTRDILDECRKALDCMDHIPLGVMIEVPAAALIADELARVSDFFSIGTNDLIQYTLAADRGDEDVANIYSPQHGAIRILLEKTVRAAKTAGIPVAMCGELAADLAWTRDLIDMGFDSLSMSLSSIQPVREQLAKNGG